MPGDCRKYGLNVIRVDTGVSFHECMRTSRSDQGLCPPRRQADVNIGGFACVGHERLNVTDEGIRHGNLPGEILQ